MPTIRRITLPDGITYDLVASTVQSDWAQTDATADDFIKNKPYVEVPTRNGGTATTSNIKIKINSTDTWMLCFVVTLYQGYRATKIMISGYNYSTTKQWYAPYAVMVADSVQRTSEGIAEVIPVTFGYDGDNELWVAFSGGQYTGVTIDSVTNGYTQVLDDINNLFTITFPSSVGGTSQQIINAVRDLNSYDASASATASKLVLRNSSGDVFARYFNTSVSDQNPASYTSSAAFIDSNGYLRKSSKANFNAWAKDDSGTKTLSSTYGCKYRKVNGICTVVIDYRTSVTATITVGTLPSGYRPPMQVMANSSQTTSAGAYMYIDTSGVVGMAKLGSGGWCIGTITYPAV